MRKSKFYRLAIVKLIGLFTFLLCAIFGSISPAADADQDGIDDNREHQLAIKYSPHYIFHPDERYYCIDPKNYINRNGAELNELFGFPDVNNPYSCRFLPESKFSIEYRGIRRYAPDGTDFSSFIGGYNSRLIGITDPEMAQKLESNGWDWENLRIKLPGGIYDEACLRKSWDAENPPPAYYLVEVNSDGNVELQFWQFYHADNKNSDGADFLRLNHMFDFSHVGIVFEAAVGNTGEVLQIFEPPLYVHYSAHQSVYNVEADSPFHPRYLLWSDVNTDQFGHPIVMVSRDQHALYFQTNRLDWNQGIKYMREGIPYEVGPNGESQCFAKPFFIHHHVFWDYYDQVGVGVKFLPTVIINLGNGIYPNSNEGWFAFGGRWADNGIGPLRGGAYISFMEHNRYLDPLGSAGSVAGTYAYLSLGGYGQWAAFCNPFYYWFDEYPRPITVGILEPLGFYNTAHAVVNDRFPQSVNPDRFRVEFKAVTRNTGDLHADLDANNHIIIRYESYPNGEIKSATVWDGETVSVSMNTGGRYWVEQYSSNSQDDHFWEAVDHGVHALPADPRRLLNPVRVTIDVIEKCKIEFSVYTIPTSELQFTVFIHVATKVALPGYMFATYELTAGTQNDINLPMGASYWWGPTQIILEVDRKRLATIDYFKVLHRIVEGPTFVPIEYYLQNRMSVDLVGASDFALSTDLVDYTQFGENKYLYNIYGRWINWCDSGSAVVFDSCLNFYPQICAKSPTRFVANQAQDTIIDYSFSGRVDFNTFQVTSNEIDEEALGLSAKRLVWRTQNSSTSSSIYMYDYSSSQIAELSTYEGCGPRNRMPMICGNVMAWLSQDTYGVNHKIIVHNLNTSNTAIAGNVTCDSDYRNGVELSITSDRVGWIWQKEDDYSRIGIQVYDVGSSSIIEHWESSYMGISEFELAIDLSGPNTVWSHHHKDMYDFVPKADIECHIPIISSDRSDLRSAINLKKIDPNVFMVPSISGYDVAYVTNWVWWTDYKTLAYVDVSQTWHNPIMGYAGKHYTIAFDWDDTVSNTSKWDVPKVSGGYIAVGSPRATGGIYGFRYLPIREIKEKCANHYMADDQSTDYCFSQGLSWTWVDAIDYDMSGCNFVLIDSNYYGFHSVFYQGATEVETTLSLDSLPKKEPAISGFDAAWLGHDGNDWEVFMSIGAPRPEEVVSQQLDNSAVYAIDSIIGTGFQNGARVFLTNGKGHLDEFSKIQQYDVLERNQENGNLIEASNVQIRSDSMLTCEIDLIGLEAGQWGLAVLNPDGQIGALANSVTINPEQLPDLPSLLYPANGETNVPLETNLSWETAARADSYFVYIGYNPDSLFMVWKGALLSYLERGLENSREYFWRVDSKNFGGITIGYIDSFTTICQIPGQPLDPVPPPGEEDIKVEGIDLCWSNVSGADSYSVSLWPTFGTDSLTSTVWDTCCPTGNLNSLNWYHWRVIPINTAGAGDTLVSYFKTSPESAPLPPSNCRPADGDTGVTTNFLRWDSCLQADHYDIYFGLDNPPPQMGYAIIPEVEYEWMLPDTTYFWQIVSINSIGRAEGPIWTFHTAKQSRTTPSVLGNVIYYDLEKKIAGSVLNIIGADGSIEDTSDTWGLCYFSPVPPGEYTACASKSSIDMGLSVADCIGIRRHVTNLDRFIDAYICVAGDADCNDVLDTNDILAVKRSLVELDSLPNGNWKLLDSLFQVDTSNWASAPSCREFSLMDSTVVTVSFIGIRCGDVNNSWFPNLDSINQPLALKEASVVTQISLERTTGAIGDTVSLPVSITGDGKIAGLEFHLSFDSTALKCIGVTSDLPAGEIVNWVPSRAHLIWENIWESIEADSPNEIAGIVFVIMDGCDDSTAVVIAGAESCDSLGNIYTTSVIDGYVVISDPSDVGDENMQSSSRFEIRQNFPNPFNPVTLIKYSIPERSHVSIDVFNIIGQRVRKLVDEVKLAGNYQVIWDGKDDSGTPLATGVYLYRIHAGDFVETKKMLLIK